jgi:20S proteasome alpha/beta subunit
MKNFLEKRYTEGVELEDAVHLAILMLRENYEGKTDLDIVIRRDEREKY